MSLLNMIKELRKNSRTPISKISKTKRMTSTTAYRHFKYIKKKYTKKFATLIHFEKLGYRTRVIFLLNTKELKGINTQPINTMTKLRGKHGLMIECYFRTPEEASRYEELLEKYKPRTHYIVEEICHEDFLTK